MKQDTTRQSTYGLLATGTALLLASCVQLETEEFASVRSELAFVTSVTGPTATVGTQWPTREIPVCFADPAGTNDYSKTVVEATLRGSRSWTRFANVTFTDFSTCDAAFTYGIEVTFSSIPMTNVYGHDSTITTSLSIPAATSTPTQRCIDVGISGEDCTEAVTLHEFGHALSLAHPGLFVPASDPCHLTQSSLVTLNEATWNVAFDEDSIMSRCRNPLTKARMLSQQDRAGIDRFLGRAEWADSVLHDFDGGSADLLCHDATTGSVAFDSGVNGSTDTILTPAQTSQFCSSDSGRLHFGDFNGDGVDDILCHNIVVGNYRLAYGSSSGVAAMFASVESGAHNWCYADSHRLLVGDFNGDGFDDLLCHQSTNGRYWIDYARTTPGLGAKRFEGTDWSSTLNWCTDQCNFPYPASGSRGEFGSGPGKCLRRQRLHVGDFNNDNFADLLCHEPRLEDGVPSFGGKLYYNFNSQYGSNPFSASTSATEPGPFCFAHGSKLHIGDFNADGRDDLYCQQASPSVALASAATSTHPSVTGSASWCFLPEQFLYVGDLDGTGGDDLVCHSVVDGRIWVDYSTGGSTPFGGTDASYSPSFCTDRSKVVY